jgi:DNA-binding NarL/FixJ family response regulator
MTETKMQTSHSESTRDVGFTLTPRERDVLSGLRTGQCNKDIAKDLECSVKTVEFHISNLLRKCRVSSRLELVVSMTAPE